MPDDTLKQRAEKFRREWFITDEGIFVDVENETKDFKDMLIAEIKWARKNPPDLMDLQEANPKMYGRSPYTFAWQSFADHLLACLGDER